MAAAAEQVALVGDSAVAVEVAWPHGRVYSPAEVGAQRPEDPPHHRACTICGGHLQGSREVVGVCLNCEEGRGWVVQQVGGQE